MLHPGFLAGIPRRSFVVFGAAGALWLLLCTLVGLLLWNDRRDEIDDAKLRGAATTALLQAHTATTFHAVDSALSEVAKTLEHRSPAPHEESFRREMRHRLVSMPYVRALFVIGPDGRIQHDTDFPTTPDVSLADRPYFRQYLQPDAPVTTISAPMTSRSGLGWFVAVTRRIGPDPEFRGVAVAAIQLAYFSDLYKVVGLGDGSEIVLFHRDGMLMAQYPGTNGRIGDSYATFPLFREHLVQAATGAYLTTAAPLPYARVVNYAALRDLPLVVAQAQNMELRLTRWNNRVITATVGMVLLLASMLYMAMQYLRSWQDKQLQQEHDVQREKMEALGQLTGGIAHDFRNILGVIAMNVSLIRKMGLSASAAASLDRAQRAVDSGTALTRQLMAFSRKRELHRLSCDLNQEIASVFGLLEHAAGPGCKLVFEAGELAGRCVIDREEFAVALINLIANAGHSIEHSGLVTIRTYVSGKEMPVPAPLRKGSWICLSVIDNGHGMSEEVRRRAVEPFFTTKGEEGTGFGLSQTYAMMQQLGGDLTIDSRIGVGTSIHLCFPAERQSPP